MQEKNKKEIYDDDEYYDEKGKNNVQFFRFKIAEKTKYCIQ